MKNFLSVLYRRILYKIPLKLLLILLAVFGLLFACTKADLILYNSYDIFQSVGGNYNTNNIIPSGHDLYCVKNKTCTANNLVIYLDDYGRRYMQNGTDTYGICGYSNIVYYSMTAGGCQFVVDVYDFGNYTSLQCQTEYNLIPISSVDQSYCTSNNLCPSSDCPSYTGDLTPGVSNIWINDIFHPGAFNVIMNIPEEIDWDYAYTNSGQNMNIDVVGFNVDYDYINDVVDSQNYKPNSDDLSSIVSQIIPLFVPGLCIILLLYFIFRFIKKIF